MEQSKTAAAEFYGWISPQGERFDIDSEVDDHGKKAHEIINSIPQYKAEYMESVKAGAPVDPYAFLLKKGWLRVIALSSYFSRSGGIDHAIEYMSTRAKSSIIEYLSSIPGTTDVHLSDLSKNMGHQDFEGTAVEALEAMGGSVNHMEKTAASPSYMGEYNFDQFKRMARPGQIWQTSNSMLRIDKLAGNLMTRRMSRFLKFYGAYTGTSPRALKSLMPQKDGKFLSSSGPWTVSRKYEPFLLLKTDVHEGLGQGLDQIEQEQSFKAFPADTTAVPLEQSQGSNLAQQRPELDLNLEDSPDFGTSLPSIQADLSHTVFESETMAGLILQCQAAYRGFDSTWAQHPGHDNQMNQAFNIKVQRLEIPQFAREAFGNKLNDFYESYTYFVVDAYVKQLPYTFGWVKQAFTTGRSGGWLEVEIDISKLFDDYVSQYTPDGEADEFVEDAINDNLGGQFTLDELNEMDSLAQRELGTYLAKLLPAIKRATLRLGKLERNVKAEYRSYVNTMQSEEFWRDEIAERGL